MNTQILLKISLVSSLIGILALLFIAEFLEPKLTNIENINAKMLNQKVKVQGDIFNIQDKGTFQIISIKDETGKIDILCECDSSLISKNQKIEVIGTVQEYGEYLQIQANKIKKI